MAEDEGYHILPHLDSYVTFCNKAHIPLRGTSHLELEQPKDALGRAQLSPPLLRDFHLYHMSMGGWGSRRMPLAEHRFDYHFHFPSCEGGATK